MGVILYLVLKFIAVKKEKVSLESMVYVVSATQFALSEDEITSFL